MNNQRRKKLDLIIKKLSEIRDHITDIKDEEEKSYENLPENLMETERADKMSENCDQLDECIDMLEDVVSILEEVKE